MYLVFSKARVFALAGKLSPLNFAEKEPHCL